MSSVREKNKINKRKNILEAAMRLFSKNGFEHQVQRSVLPLFHKPKKILFARFAKMNLNIPGRNSPRTVIRTLRSKIC